jgi:hypothetical protein
LAQGEVLKGELAMPAEEEWEEPKQVEKESDHRAEIVAGSEPTDQLLAGRMRLSRRTGARACTATAVSLGRDDVDDAARSGS